MHDYTYLLKERDRPDPDDALGVSFASPMLRDIGESWHRSDVTYDFRTTTIILEEEGYGRADYSIWERDVESGVWALEDDSPGIVELMNDQQYDEPCADCLSECIVEYPEFTHSDDCALDDSGKYVGDYPDEHTYYCCDAHRTALEQAHAIHKEKNETTCTLYPDFAMLDGGDVLCRHHVAEWHNAKFLNLRRTEPDELTADGMTSRYFASRRELGDELTDIPDPRVLWQLANLDRSRRIIEHADHERVRRDDAIGTLRDDVSQSTIGRWAGVSQQRVGQIIGEREQWSRDFHERIERETQTK